MKVQHVKDCVIRIKGRLVKGTVKGGGRGSRARGDTNWCKVLYTQGSSRCVKAVKVSWPG